jgi:hypothetical protein
MRSVGGAVRAWLEYRLGLYKDWRHFILGKIDHGSRNINSRNASTQYDPLTDIHLLYKMLQDVSLVYCLEHKVGTQSVQDSIRLLSLISEEHKIVCVLIVTTHHIKTGTEPIPETSWMMYSVAVATCFHSSYCFCINKEEYL